jgi:hypothetical protein
MRQAKKGCDRPKGEPRRHQEGRVHGVIVRLAEVSRDRINANDLCGRLDGEQKKSERGRRGDDRQNRDQIARTDEIERRHEADGQGAQAPDESFEYSPFFSGSMPCSVHDWS